MGFLCLELKQIKLPLSKFKKSETKLSEDTKTHLFKSKKNVCLALHFNLKMSELSKLHVLLIDLPQ